MVMLAAWVATFVLGTQMQPHTATLAERLVDAADTPAKWVHALLWLSRAQMAEFLAVIPFMVSVSTSPLVHSHTATVVLGVSSASCAWMCSRAAFAHLTWLTNSDAKARACNLNMYALRFVMRLQAQMTAREWRSRNIV